MNDTREPDTDRTPAVIEPPELPTVDLTTMTLDDLAAFARAEDGLSASAVTLAVAHAVRAGAALLAAREQVPRGKWTAWLIDSGIGIGHAYTYMRLAMYRDEIPPGASLSQARDGLRTLPGIFHRPDDDKRAVPASLREEAKAMVDGGMGVLAVAEALGIDRHTVAAIIDPEKARRRRESGREQQRRRRAALKLLAKKEQDRQVKQVGGSAAEGYALLRRAEIEIDRAVGSSLDVEEKAALRRALSWAHKAKDEIVAALKLKRVP